MKRVRPPAGQLREHPTFSTRSGQSCEEAGGQVDFSNTPMTQAPPTVQQEAAEERCSERTAPSRGGSKERVNRLIHGCF